MRLYSVSANRSDDAFAFGAPAPMSIPRDVDAAGTVIVPLLIPATGASITSHTPSTTVSAVPVTAAGEVLVWEAYLWVPTAAHLFGRFRVRIPWEVLVGGNVGSRGRVTADIRRRRSGAISVLTGVAAYLGPIRALDVPGRYNENNLIVQVQHSAGRFIESDDLVLRVAVAVTTQIAGGATATIILHHDPGVPNDALVCETDWQLRDYDGIESR